MVEEARLLPVSQEQLRVVVPLEVAFQTGQVGRAVMVE
jgi:hypothetical protein